jgi:hypothetical protein
MRRLRRGAPLLCAMVMAMAPSMAQATPTRFDPRDGEITIGEVLTLITSSERESLTTVLTVESERPPTSDEVSALLGGRELPGFTVLNRVSSPPLDTRLNDIGPVFSKKAPFVYTITMVGAGGRTYKIECTLYEQDDGSTRKVCKTPAD